MIHNRKVLGVVIARGGSKGLPKKNILKLANEPLISYTINEANGSKYIDRLILSSEDEEIIRVAKSYDIDIPFVRPMSLAGDSIPGIDVVLHAIKEIPGYDIVVVLQPTSPLRTTVDIDVCIEKIITRGTNSCVSVTESSKSPYWMFELGVDEKFIPVIKETPLVTIRQNLPKTYEVNGAVYALNINWFINKKEFINDETIAYIMPPERSVDIDNHIDFLTAELLIGE